MEGANDRGVVGDGLFLEDEEEFDLFEELPDEDCEPGLTGRVTGGLLPGGHHSGRFSEESATAISNEKKASYGPYFT